MEKTLVIEYRGNLAWSGFEKEISKILGRNEGGTGFSFLTGRRDISGYFKTQKALDSKMQKIKEFAKSKRVKVTMKVYDEESF